MNERVARLREASARAVPTISTERAELLTRFYRDNEGKYPVPVLRALSFKHICQHKTIFMGYCYTSLLLFQDAVEHSVGNGTMNINGIILPGVGCGYNYRALMKQIGYMA